MNYRDCIKKYLLIVLQALCVVVVSACICIYSFYSLLQVKSLDNSFLITHISISDFRAEYYDSELYTENLKTTVYDAIRYSVIKKQLETDGVYDPNKIIYIGEYANRKSGTEYNGPEVGYYLKDLIAWGQYGISQNGIAHSYKTFDSWEDMYSFFGKNGENSSDNRIFTEAEEASEEEIIEENATETTEETLSEISDTEGGAVESEAVMAENDETESNPSEETKKDEILTTGTVTVDVGDDPEESYSVALYGMTGSDDTDGDTEYYYASINGEDVEIAANSVPMLDVITNRYLTAEGHTLEYYAYGESDYKVLCDALETTASSIYSNYTEYVAYNELFAPENSNLRFFVFDGENEYTNDAALKDLSPSELSEKMKGMGEYIHARPFQYEFLTNTPVSYEYVTDALANYIYAFNDASFLWIALDTTYPVDDYYSSNYYAVKRTLSFLPWVISFAAIGVIGFVTLLVYIISTGKRRLSYADAGDDLKFLDKLPIELEVLTCGGIFFILYVFGIFLFGDKTLSNAGRLVNILTPTLLISFLYSFTLLLFLYSFLRRFITRTIFKNSYFVSLGKWIYRKSEFIQRVTGRVYNSTGMAVRTWAEYIFFLIFNTFWACMLFFSEFPGISFIVLLVFDAATGLILFNRDYEKRRIIEAINMVNDGDFDLQLPIEKFHGSNRELAIKVNGISDALKLAVETSSKDERLKADLITNVSHDIKTPLTSIINYVDLIKRENIDNERVNNYVRILDEKSQRLKQLTIDLVEASKITSGNITLEINRINLLELLNQAKGEFEDKYNEKQLTLVETKPDSPVIIDADARYIWRIVENLFQNAYKYALEGTRVYLDVSVDEKLNCVTLALKNISRQQLNINADELTERFIRGDLARSTEGSGLGLSIVKSLVKAHNGKFFVYLDGDLFKATVMLPIARKEAKE